MLSDPIRKAGFTLTIVDGGIGVTPASKLTQDQRQYLKRNRVAILAELRQPKEPLPEDMEAITEALAEKAAALEYCGNMPREEATKQAPKAVGVFSYTLTDHPGKTFTVIASSCTQVEGRKIIEDQYGESRVGEVHHFPWRSGQ